MYFPDFLPHHKLPVLLNEEAYKNPKQVIIQFFDSYHLVDAVTQLEDCLLCAFSHLRLRRKPLLRIMAMKEMLLVLLEAATLLKDEGKATLAADEPNPMDTRWYYYNKYKDYEEWDYFPHHLCKKQYYNPYIVFKQCSKKSTLPQWRSLLEGLFAAAAYYNMTGEDGCINYSSAETNAYTQCKRLIELVEAAHLVYIRERLFEPKTNQNKEAA